MGRIAQALALAGLLAGLPPVAIAQTQSAAIRGTRHRFQRRRGRRRAGDARRRTGLRPRHRGHRCRRGVHARRRAAGQLHRARRDRRAAVRRAVGGRALGLAGRGRHRAHRPGRRARRGPRGGDAADGGIPADHLGRRVAGGAGAAVEPQPAADAGDAARVVQRGQRPGARPRRRRRVPLRRGRRAGLRPRRSAVRRRPGSRRDWQPARDDRLRAGGVRPEVGGGDRDPIDGGAATALDRPVRRRHRQRRPGRRPRVRQRAARRGRSGRQRGR